MKIEKATKIEAAGNMPKIIEEFFGEVNSKNSEISIARMKSPKGWMEPGQTPEFDEYTIVMKGELKVETKDGISLISEGQALHSKKGEWIRYSTPNQDTEYFAVCLPAFSPETVHRDKE